MERLLVAACHYEFEHNANTSTRARVLRKQAEEGSAPWNLLMAAAVFSIVPVVILYVFAQKQFVEGIMRGALKG